MDDGLITPAALKSLAGTTAFRCGEEYFSVGAVGRMRVTDDRVAARVEGTEIYRVELRNVAVKLGLWPAQRERALTNECLHMDSASHYYTN